MNMKSAGKKQGLLLVVALVVLLLANVAANASSITYNVNRTIGIGSVTGFIKTDGTLGGLSSANITDWSLLLNDGTYTYNLYGPLSGNNSVILVTGADVSATAGQLLFNFSGIDNGLLLFQQGLFSGQHYYCNQAGSYACYTGETVVANSVFLAYQLATPSGNVVIGTAGASVPEPGSLALLGSGFLAAAGVFRRKFNR